MTPMIRNENDFPQSLNITLAKMKAINTVNAESLHFIESRKGQQVITQRKYYLEAKQPTHKKSQNHHHYE